MTRSFDVFFDMRLNIGWVNNRKAGDLRRYRAHNDVTVMCYVMWFLLTTRNVALEFSSSKDALLVTGYSIRLITACLNVL